jgi:hypothetical protein
MICPNTSCNRPNAEGLEHCDYCGTPLHTPAAGKRKTEAEMAPPARAAKRVTEYEGPDLNAVQDPFAPFPAAGAAPAAARPSGKRVTQYDGGPSGRDPFAPAAPVAREPATAANRYAGRRIVGWLITFDGNPDGTSHVLHEGRNLIGRDAERCDIVIDDELVSSLHALIVLRGGKQSITDQQSQNGTFLNEEDVLAPTDLNDGDVVRLGRTRLLCRLVDREKIAAIWKP